MAINSRKIAKNTVFLYARLLLILGVTLYSSRVILEVLGASDYGLYYAIFSVIGLLSFLNGTLSAGTSRFLTFELGRGDAGLLKITFSTTLFSHILLAGIILLLGETIGLWYANHILVVPPDRTTAALIVYQISIISTVISILQVPFTAEIIAHEKMDVYAYLGIYEAVARLAVVYLLLHYGTDKLVYFAALQLIVVFSVFLFYTYYSFSRFKEVSLKPKFDKKIFNSILRFSGWNIIANISETLMSQGIIMLYNLFFLPVVVAAQAIGNQIAQAMMQFVNNVRQAVNPQVIKLYADRQYSESQKLTFISAEYIFYLLLLIGIPCIMVMPKLLSIWLVEVPEYTVAFSRLIIAQQILGNFSAAFYTPMLAANKLAKNSLASVFLCIFQFAILWLMFKIGFGPLWARYLGLFACILFSFVIKPYILWKDIDYSLTDIYNCVLQCMKVLIPIVSFNIIIYIVIKQQTILQSCFVCLLSILSVITISYLFMDKQIKHRILFIIKKRLFGSI